MNVPRAGLGRDEAFARIRLLRSPNVGPVTYRQLLRRFGDAASALAALPDLAARGGGRYRPAPAGRIEDEVAAVKRAGARYLFHDFPDYPPLLAQVEGGPPILTVRGDAALASRPAVAVVGARNASAAAVKLARDFAGALAEAGFVVVSGLARGIDAAAHGAALKGGTVAVLAGGVDVPYPAENAALAATIADQGALVSEQPPGLDPQARHFPRRNRLISGLARAVVVVEAAESSGSLITARNALEQGREVLAVPGHPLDPRAAGCNRLIREGARLVGSLADLLEALEGTLPPPAAPVPSARTAVDTRINPGIDTLALHRKILSLLGPAPTPEEQLLEDLGMTPRRIAPALLFLELDGRLERRPGGVIVRL